MAASAKAFYFEILSGTVYRVTKTIHGSKTWEKTQISAKTGPYYADYQTGEEFNADLEAWEAARDEASNVTPIYSSSGQYGHSSYGGYTAYSAARLYDGVDRNRFRRTWHWLLRFHFSADYHKDTKYVSDYKAKYPLGRRPYEEA